MIQLPAPAQYRDEFQRDGFVLVRDFFKERDARTYYATSLGLVRERAVTIDRRKDGHGLMYRVVTGDRIQSEAPMLYELYWSPCLIEWVRAITNCPDLAPSSQVRSGLNINCLMNEGDGYPMHRDATPYTALLFLTSLDAACGGEFLIRSARGARVTIRPMVGQFLLMDGARCAHGVAPLRRDALRLTMPMVYPAAAVARPEGLDEYLYGT